MKFFVIFVCAVLFIESKAIDLSYLEQIIASSSKNTKKLADDANVLVQTNLMLNNFLKSVDDSLGTNIGRLMTVTGQYSIQITNFRSSTVEFIRTLSLRDIIGAAGLLTRVTTDLVDLNPLVSFSDVFTAISNLRSGVEQEYKAYMNEIHGLLESRKAIPCFNASIEEFRTSLILLAVNIDNIITAEERELERQVTILGDKLVKVQPALLAQISTNCGTNSSCAINYVNLIFL